MQAAFIPALRISQRLSKPFWPPALASQAPPAIILAVLRRFRGPALFHGPRTSSRLGAPFWPSGLTLRSSGLAFSQPLTLAVRKTWKALIQRCICRGDPPFCGALFGMSFLRLSLHFSYLKMLQNAKFWCSIFLPMPGPYSVYQVASLDCWHIGLCTIHPWPKQSPQMTLSNQAVKRTGFQPAAYLGR